MKISQSVQIGKYIPLDISVLEKEFHFNIDNEMNLINEFKFIKLNSYQYAFLDELAEGVLFPLHIHQIKDYVIELIEKKYSQRLTNLKSIKLKSGKGYITAFADISFIPVLGALYLRSWKEELSLCKPGKVDVVFKSTYMSHVQLSLRFPHGLELMPVFLRNKSNDKLIRKLHQAETAYDQLAYISLLIKAKKILLKIHSKDSF